MRRTLTLCVVTLALLGHVVAPVAAGEGATGSPDVDVTLPEDTVVPGETTTLGVVLSNDGELDEAASNPAFNEQVTTAQGVHVKLEADGAPLDVRTGERAVGSIPDGGVATANFRIRVDEDAEPDTYRLPVEVSYGHPRHIGGRAGNAEDPGHVVEEDVTRTFHVTVEVLSQARFEVVNVSTDVSPGTTGRLNVTMENVGEESARDATVSLRTLSGDLGFGPSPTAVNHVGSWADGDRRTVSYVVTASEAARVRTYPFEATTTFENSRGERVTSDPLDVNATLRGGQPFSVVRTESDVTVGDDGTVTVVLQNTGAGAVRDATVTLRSATGAIAVDGGTTASRYVGAWGPGETRDLTFDATVAPSAGTRSYALDAVVAYETPDGNPASGPALAVGVTPDPAAEFGVEVTGGALYVAEQGRVVATVTNEGERPVRDVVVSLDAAPPRVRPVEPAVAVGDLAAGESVDVAFDVAVGPDAEPGSRPFALTVGYADGDGDRRRADPVTVRQSVAPERERLRVEAVNASFAPDSDNRLVVRVTNVGNETLTELTARVTPTPPFTSEGPGSYVPRLAPGESATLAFQLTVAEDAVASTHALAMNATAEAGERTVRVGPEPVAVSVVEPERATGDTTVFGAAALVVVVALAVGWWWLRR